MSAVFLALSIGNFDQFLTPQGPSPLKIAFVVYGRAPKEQYG